MGLTCECVARVVAEDDAFGEVLGRVEGQADDAVRHVGHGQVHDQQREVPVLVLAEAEWYHLD